MSRILIHIHSGPELKNKVTLGFLVAIKEGLESAEELLMDGDPQKAFEL